MAKYDFEVSDDQARTGRDGKPVYPDTISVILHKKYAWRAVKDMLKQLEDGEEWIFVYLPGALESAEEAD